MKKSPGQPQKTASSSAPPAKETEISVEAFVGAALQKYQAALISYVITIVRDPERARVVVRDTFIRLCQQDFSKVKTDLKVWLLINGRDAALQVSQKGKPSQPPDEIRWQRVAGPDLSADEKFLQDERFTKIMQLLDQLPIKQREVLILHCQQRMNALEISKITGLSSSQTKVHLHAGLKRMGELLPNDLKI
ncbi:sigma-70 family RNA polymerase sigma factor [Luteolibacter pohnpeiensis]|uniref:Sigma-70 family RNA polymerase sigma factor n=1 Tax=Luteolibacter pohnpeiensis TaxID=454153 RepID=A0A934S8T1_9BACT|nr:sigma-70 family RNA polymerase sigma factor [Luteolibacter pohnpeiensis]MBK1880938.1 sigma-70 family RNA polymerase sigma factor [Luteolibacter pohnpeiensis]